MTTDARWFARLCKTLGMAALFVAAVAVGPAGAEIINPNAHVETTPGAKTANPSGGPLAPADIVAPDTATVLGQLHRSNQMEIAAGKLAEKKGDAKEVKSFGKTLVKDHTAADKKVTALAKRQKIDLGPSMPPAEDKLAKLRDQQGAEFDKAFAAEMLDDHKKDVAEVSAARDSTKDLKLKALLQETVPVLESHRDAAEKLVTTVGSPVL
jgi:putative membrane protein